MTKRQLHKLLDDGDISPLQVKEFYKRVRAFYVRALDYALKDLPLRDELLRRNASFTSIKKRDNSAFSLVEFIDRLVDITPVFDPFFVPYTPLCPLDIILKY